MAAPKRPKLPLILMANDFLNGDTVVWDGAGWALDPYKAAIAFDDAGADALEVIGQNGFSRNEVVDAVLVDVTLDEAGKAFPNHYRERIRFKGPSIRLDLGKQAEFEL
jgi:acyl CoA:acetate/3-ketoacid CoA transferase alpha subunit